MCIFAATLSQILLRRVRASHRGHSWFQLNRHTSLKGTTTTRSYSVSLYFRFILKGIFAQIGLTMQPWAYDLVATLIFVFDNNPYESGTKRNTRGFIIMCQSFTPKSMILFSWKKGSERRCVCARKLLCPHFLDSPVARQFASCRKLNGGFRIWTGPNWKLSRQYPAGKETASGTKAVFNGSQTWSDQSAFGLALLSPSGPTAWIEETTACFDSVCLMKPKLWIIKELLKKRTQSVVN